jgi:hypothetical protein
VKLGFDLFNVTAQKLSLPPLPSISCERRIEGAIPNPLMKASTAIAQTSRLAG